MFSKAIVAILAASTVSAAPAPAALLPWQITSLFTHSPSGRPGNNPYSMLNVSIHEPNLIPAADSPTGMAAFAPSTANCSAQWLTSADVPWNIRIPCIDDARFGNWSFKLTPGTGEAGTGATTDFGLEFLLFESMRVIGPTVYTHTFIAKDQFKVGDNLSGDCGASGVCGWQLTTHPYAINQTEIA